VPIGTFRQYVAVKRDQVILSPEHLSDEQAAAWPLGAVTAWRYVGVLGVHESN
jgi:NADPH:quinone reductase-like Zn-dependent oxidoreductase